MKQGWEIKKLKDVTSLITDGDWIESRHQSEDGIRLIQTGNVGNGFFKAKDDKPHFISEETFDVLGCTEIFEGDCLVSRLPDPVGRACLIPEMDCRMITAVDCSIIRFNENLVPDFFVYYSQSSKYQNEISNKTTGTTRKRVSRKNLEMIPIPVPPIAEQEKIVAELDCLSGIIEKKKQQLKELDALAQSIFYELFGNPVENDKGWNMIKLKDLSSLIINGTTPKGGAEVYVDNGILFLRSQNVWRNLIDYDDVAYIDDKTNASMKRSILHKNDILITKTGRINTENSSLGRAAMFDGDTGSANINGHVYLIRIDSNLVLPRFVLSILTGIVYRDYIRKVCVGGIDKRQINKEHVENFPIILPSISLQQQYVEIVENIEKQKEMITLSLKDAETLFNSRMDYYFN